MATKLVDTRLAAWFSSHIQICLLDVHAGPAGKNEQLFSEATVSFWKANFKMGKNGKQKQRLLITWLDSSNFSSQSWLQETNGKQKAHNGKKKSPVGCFIMSLHFLEFTFFFQLEAKWTHQIKFYQLVCFCYTECFSFCKVFFFFFSSIDMNSPPKKPPKTS